MEISSGSAVIRKADRTSISNREFAEINEIYARVFPIAEQRPLAEVVSAPNAHTWLAYMAHSVVGFAFAATLDTTGVALLQYIGVDPANQSNGIGRKLLERIDHDLTTREMREIVLEVEDPTAPLADPYAARRIEFYRRWGAHELRCLERYFMPNLADPTLQMPMILLWRPLRQNLAQPSGDNLRSLLTSIFENEYADLATAHHLADLVRQVRC